MGFFSGILGAAAPILGGLIGGPAGAAIGSVIGPGISGAMNARDANEQRTDLAYQTSAFNAQEAERAREFNSAEAQMARNFNAQEAEEQRNWANYMSSTSYTRAVADMKNAGLNPMLAYSQGGASSPGGASASGPAASGPGAVGALPQNIENEGASGVTNAVAYAQTLKLLAEADLAKSKADIERESVPYAKRTAEERFRMTVNESDIKAWEQHVVQRLSSESYGRDGLSERVAKFRAEVDEIRQEVRTSRSREALNRSVEKLNRLDVPRGMAFSNFFESAVGRASPYTDHIGKNLSSAAEVAKDLYAPGRGAGVLRKLPEIVRGGRR